MIQRLLLFSILLLTCHCGGGGGGGGGGPAPTPVAAPTLVSINPSSAAPSQVVTLEGMDFDVSPSSNTVQFGSTNANVLSGSTMQLMVEVPSLAPGSTSVTVTTSAGASNSVNFTITMASVTDPSISALNPSLGTVGSSFLVMGQNFDPGGQNTVTIGGVSASVVTNSSTELQVTVPAGSQSGSVIVSTGGRSSNAVQFLVTSNVAANQGFSGSQAVDFLSDTQFTHLVVEIDHINGKAPTTQAINLLRTRLNERCRKPGGITIIVDDDIPAQGQTEWTIAELMMLESQFRDHYRNGNTNVLYFVYVNDASEFDTANSSVLGVAYTGSSLGMFRDNIDNNAGPLVGRATIEQAVIVHEAGHNLGLVNNGIAMVNNHQDTANGRHDVNNGCVMHFSIETDAISQLVGGIPNQFDAECIADMQAAGGK